MRKPRVGNRREAFNVANRVYEQSQNPDEYIFGDFVLAP